MSDNLLSGILAFQKEQAALREQRQAEMAGLNFVLPKDLFSDDSSLPQFPWVWYRDQLVVLKPGCAQDSSHRFGGESNARWSGLEKGCLPYLLLDLDPQALLLNLPATGTFSRRLPLFHPLKASHGADLLYRVNPDGSLTATKSPKGNRGDRDWPYPNYPKSLPIQNLSVEGPYPVPFLYLLEGTKEQTFSVQELPEDSAGFLIVVVPTCEETLGFDLLGEDAESEGAQLVFLVHPETGAVWTYNQCG